MSVLIRASSSFYPLEDENMKDNIIVHLPWLALWFNMMNSI